MYHLLRLGKKQYHLTEKVAPIAEPNGISDVIISKSVSFSVRIFIKILFSTNPV